MPLTLLFSSCRPVSAILITALLVPATRAAIDIAIDPAAGHASISPYIYGTNADLPGVKFNLRRQGGNRMTGYNWETNASNAGNDYLHESDDYLTSVAGITGSAANIPGIVVTDFQDKALAAGTTYSIATLPMAGYVAADKAGPVAAADAAPSTRWFAVANTKPTALSTTPDLADGKVYTDELLNFLVTRYGPASGTTGIKGYDLDNEPDLWSNGQKVNGVEATGNNGTHPLLHPAKPLAAELITRSVDTAKTVKRIDPSAETLGFVSYGFNGYLGFQDSTDWSTEKTKGSYRWYIDYFLDQMKQASTTAGTRLLDVLDLHNYTEATGGGVRVNDSTDYTNVVVNKARMQAPRSFWDTTYVEDSWIGQYGRSFLPWLPNIKQSIDTFYPGTKLGFTEYAFGGEGHISGGIAQADILGIFGKYGVYLAALWPWGDDHTYAVSAFKLYLDYDGANNRFGDTSVSATNPDAATCSVYASVDSKDSTRLHVIVLNKSYDAPTTFNFSVAGTRNYTSARVFAFDGTSATITERTAVAAITGNQFSYTLPALTAAHFVIESSAFSQQPAEQSVAIGATATFTAAASGATSYQWQHNGTNLAGSTSATLSLPNVQPGDAGLYSVLATTADGTTASDLALLGLSITDKVVGAGTELDPHDIVHPNGNIFDQILLTGAAEAITADSGQVTRTSFIDLDDDIVQVEFSGPGTLSLVLDNSTPPTPPVNYNQNVNYMKGHAGIVIAGADERTNVSVFTVGRATAVNQALFKNDVVYDGIADIAFIAITTTNGKFGGVRTSNANYFASKGVTGVYAPGVAFQGPVYVGNITAFDAATPMLVIGSSSDTRITGGDLLQDNDQPVEVSGLTQLKFTAGSDSQGNTLTAKTNRGVLQQSGTDVTSQIVVNPTP